MTYCAQCGKAMPPEALFCPACGKASSPSTAETQALGIAEMEKTPAAGVGVFERIGQWILIAFLGLLMIVGLASIGINTVLIAHGEHMDKTTSQGTLYWIVGFTYFFNKYYWKRNDKTRPNGVVTGVFSAILVEALILGVGIVFSPSLEQIYP